MLHQKDLENICKLAKIKIDEDKKEIFLYKLNMVFNWIEQLDKIDVGNIDINNLCEMDSTAERSDIAITVNTKEQILSNTVHKKFDMFSVPKVVE